MYNTIISKLPGIQEAKTHLSFKSRLKWTGIILLLFLVLGQITLYGVDPEGVTRIQYLEMIMGASFGSLITLGIGPIVTASIILQLLVGSKIIPWDLKSPDGRKKFQGTQKLLTILFCIFEAYAYVAFGAIRPSSADPMMMMLLIGQIAFGGFLILLMDEVVSKWGIGSGVSLFIAAGVAKTIFVRTFNPIVPLGGTLPAGIIPQVIALLGTGNIFEAITALLPLFATLLVFLIVVYAQSIKVEIPLAFGSIRGFSRRWPLNLIYTSNIPVILTAALLANFQLISSMVAAPTETGRCGFLGCFDESGQVSSGIAYYLQTPQGLSTQIFFLTLLAVIFAIGFLAFYFKYQGGSRLVWIAVALGFVSAFLITSNFGFPTFTDILRSISFLLFMVIGSVIFSIFWVATAGMDARSVSEQIEGMGMQIPGFRRDPRIVEQVLNRYIPSLAIISGVFIGLLATMADFTNAVGTGTGILLTVMIIHNLYEQISMRYMEDMHPALRKFFS